MTTNAWDCQIVPPALTVRSGKDKLVFIILMQSKVKGYCQLNKKTENNVNPVMNSSVRNFWSSLGCPIKDTN